MDPTTFESPTRTRIPLSGEWLFRSDPQNRGLAEGWQHRLPGDTGREPSGTCTIPCATQTIPELSNYESPAGFPNGYLGTIWFKRTFELPKEAGRWFLIVGGVAPAAHLYLDDRYVGFHSFPMVATEFDISAYATPGRHSLTIVVVEQEIGMMGGYRFAGHAWSGIYREIWLESRPAATVRSCWTRIDGESVVVEADIIDSRSADERGPLFVSAAVGDHELLPTRSQDRPDHAGGESADAHRYVFRFPATDLARWRATNAALLSLRIALSAGGERPSGDATRAYGEPIDTVTRTIGLSSLHPDGSRLVEHGDPVFLAGAGQEFFSPTIGPLTDSSIIDARATSLRSCGFSLFRHHTHVPTPEELAAADRHGIYLCAEVSLVSNFAQVKPFDRGLEMLRAFVYQSRHHPSLAIYCLGNEGTQLMVDEGADGQDAREHARLGYEEIKRLAPDRIVLAAFGSQGELPDQPNDAETPHLWSHEFRWGHDGLTRIPWWGLHTALRSKPALLHEYGKFGVWPSPADEEALVPGYRLHTARDAAQALKDAGINVDPELVARNARALAACATQLILEDARRARGIDGFVLWTFFRMGPRNGGIANDAGTLDIDPAPLRDGAAAQTALLSDLGFDRRTVATGTARRVSYTVSTMKRLATGSLRVRMAGRADRVIDVPPMEAGASAEFTVTLADSSREHEAAEVALPIEASTVEAELSISDEIVARSCEPVWIVHETDAPRGRIVCDATAPSLRTLLPGAISLGEFDAAVRGCRTWSGHRLAEAFTTAPPSLVITDRLGEGMELAREHGVPLLLADSGHFPEEWYADGYPAGEHDVFRMFVPFRAGWDQGNVATVIEPSDLLTGVPHERWCDLLWFNAIHGASSLRTQELSRTLGIEARPVVRVIPRLRPLQSDPPVQDPNALRDRTRRLGPSIRTEDRGYLYESPAGASDSAAIVVTSLSHDRDVFGRELLHRIVRHLVVEE